VARRSSRGPAVGSGGRVELPPVRPRRAAPGGRRAPARPARGLRAQAPGPRPWAAPFWALSRRGAEKPPRIADGGADGGPTRRRGPGRHGAEVPAVVVELRPVKGGGTLKAHRPPLKAWAPPLEPWVSRRRSSCAAVSRAARSSCAGSAASRGVGLRPWLTAHRPPAHVV